MTNHIIWMNGTFYEGEAASPPVSIHNRGFLLGDGLFETMLIHNGQIAFLDAHLERLYNSFPFIYMTPRFTKSECAQACHSLRERVKDKNTRFILRLTVSREGGRGLGLIDAQDLQNWLMVATPAPPRPESVAAYIASHKRPTQSITSRLKTTNYLDNLLARHAATLNGADEALMLNEYDRLACAAAGNIFLINKTHILTPPLTEGALAGTRRHILLKQADMIKARTGLILAQEKIETERLADSHALFITNSISGCVPVRTLNGEAKPISPFMPFFNEVLERQA